MYIDNVLRGNVAFSSYDANGYRYEIAPLRRVNGQNPLTNNVPLLEAWHVYRQNFYVSQSGVHLTEDPELSPYMIRQIINPLATNASYDIVPLEDCLVDSDGNCDAMPNEIPVLRSTSASIYSAQTIINRNGDIMLTKTLDERNVDPGIATWHNAGSAFVTVGPNGPYFENRIIMITQDAGVTWDVCKPSEFTTTTV